ncbi:hypothetical protein C1I98_06075 [Spongiactinospora gelatinilytica]|uniref:Uncharacterized protein n=2 Tax=Spongiactinospora gelatinilytica TaxID=2666298 RepID=A0A2W2GYK2_9ACTN|nr:hypothetical protein C1I98_06075 [Spongiactinospora gelatinilytica]
MWTIRTRDPAMPDAPDHCYMLPSITFENLAVEYGLDPDDIDELLRVAILQLEIPAKMMTSSGAARDLLRGGRPVTLDNAESTAQAREAHLKRIALVEADHVRIAWPKPGMRVLARTLDADVSSETEVDPYQRLEALKATYRPDRKRMGEKRMALSTVLGREV